VRYVSNPDDAGAGVAEPLAWPVRLLSCGAAKLYLGEALRGQGRLPEAEPLLLEGYRAVMGSASSRRDRPFATASLVRLYEAEGRYDEAAKYRPR